MHPIDFKEQNQVFNKPKNMTDEQCKPLPSFVGKDTDGFPIIVSCWELTPDEIKKLNETGKIYLTVVGSAMPPISLQAESPFVYDEINP